MRVRLMAHHPEPLRAIFAQARLCTSPHGFAHWYGAGYPGDERALALVRKVLESGHWSVTRGVTFTFSIEGISRACSHQLVRHTVGVAHEQQSQRYVEVDTDRGDWYVVPPEIRADREALDRFQAQMAAAARTYRDLLARGVPPEDARFVLPNATKTNLVSTFSFEALKNFLAQRLCTRAQWEIRTLAKEMRREVVRRWPWMGPYLTIKCRPGQPGSLCPERWARDCPLLRANGGRVPWMWDET